MAITTSLSLLRSLVAVSRFESVSLRLFGSFVSGTLRFFLTNPARVRIPPLGSEECGELIVKGFFIGYVSVFLVYLGPCTTYTGSGSLSVILVVFAGIQDTLSGSSDKPQVISRPRSPLGSRPTVECMLSL